MRKVILFCFLYSITILSYAEMCPPANKILNKRDGKYDVVPPPGWRLVINDKNPAQKDLVFRVAAWGDHKHPSDNVRCHYYHDVGDEHVQLETEEFIDESRIASHPEWSNDERYHLCVSRSDNVNECPFG